MFDAEEEKLIKELSNKVPPEIIFKEIEKKRKERKARTPNKWSGGLNKKQLKARKKFKMQKESRRRNRK